MIQNVTSLEMPVDEEFRIVKNHLTHGQGPRICIVTGTHGDELEGQYVCYLIAKMVRENLEHLSGTVDIYPALNPLGIDSMQRGVPAFDLDMNRIFPGNPRGSMVEKVAHDIYTDLSGADMVIDIHASNIFLREIPQVRISEMTAEKLVPSAKLMGIDFIWIHQAATVLESTLAHSLNSTGTPCLVAEMGVGGRINRPMCQHLVDGIAVDSRIESGLVQIIKSRETSHHDVLGMLLKHAGNLIGQLHHELQVLFVEKAAVGLVDELDTAETGICVL